MLLQNNVKYCVFFQIVKYINSWNLSRPTEKKLIQLYIFYGYYRNKLNLIVETTIII